MRWMWIGCTHSSPSPLRVHFSAVPTLGLASSRLGLKNLSLITQPPSPSSNAKVRLLTISLLVILTLGRSGVPGTTVASLPGADPTTLNWMIGVPVAFQLEGL